MSVMKYYFLLLVYHYLGYGMATEDIWNYCLKEVCGMTSSKSLICDEDSIILIYYVQSATDNNFHQRSFQQFRNSCMGRKHCNHANLCINTRLKVTYTCVKEKQIMKSCSNNELSKPVGFIQNDRYPSTSVIGACQWKIHVPQGSFIILRFHDVMLTEQKKGNCVAGLKMVTEKQCEGHNFTSDIICTNKQSFQSRYFIACGSVTLIQVKGRDINHFRFWISYEVKPFTTPNLSYLYDKNLSCIESNKGYKKWKINQVNSPHLSHVSFNHSILSETTRLPFNATSPMTDLDNHNGTLNTGNKMKPSAPPYNLKLILAIAAPLLAIILFVSIGMCYWRGKRRRKNNPVSAKDAAVQTPISRHIENVRHGQANGILPLQYSDRHHPAIQEGYSHVADEVPFPEAAKMIDAAVGTCEAYTEVDEGQMGAVKPLSDRFRFHIARSLPALPGKKSSSNDEWTSTRSRGSSSRASIGSQSDYQKAIYEEISDYYICQKNPSNYSPRVSEPSSVETDSGIESEDKIARSRLERIQNPTNPAASSSHSNPNPNFNTNTNSSSSSTSSSSASHKSPPVPALNARGEIKSDDTSTDVTDPKYHVIERNYTQNNVGESNCRGHSIARSGDDGLVLLENEIYEPYYQQTD